MANPLTLFWRNMFDGGDGARTVQRHRIPTTSAAQASATIFLVIRRLRIPLVALILIFAVSVLGLTLIPGEDATGQPWHMSIFDAFYFMSFTATTIGFGELPHPFTELQRLWVTATIYLTVIGWAYAIGTLFSMLQDRAFREALALQRFTRKVARLREPFVIIAGYGATGRLLGRSLDLLGRRFVVLDRSDDRVTHLELDAYHADVPGLVGDARNPAHLGVAGLGHDYCEGVLALTDDDEVNLAVTMSAALLRPELPVIARTVSTTVADRMRAFGTPAIVNPFDRFGDHLRLAIRAPASYQLLSWLENGPGAELPHRGQPPASGRWVICGYGRFGRQLAADLRREGLKLTIVDPYVAPDADAAVIVGDCSDPAVMGLANVAAAVGFVAGTDNDTTNLSLVSAARRVNPDLFVAARQNEPVNAALFNALPIDSLLVPTELVAHEVYAQLSTPLLWRFLQEMPALGDTWAASLIDSLTNRCGDHLDALWNTKLTGDEAPAIVRMLSRGDVTLGDVLRDPDYREQRLDVVPLLLLRGGNSAGGATLAPPDDTLLAPHDELLLAGTPGARRAIESTLLLDAAAQFAVTGQRVAASWVWRRLSRAPATTTR